MRGLPSADVHDLFRGGARREGGCYSRHLNALVGGARADDTSGRQQGAQVGGGLGGAQQLVPNRQDAGGLPPDAEVDKRLVPCGEAEVEAEALEIQPGYVHRAEIRTGGYQAGEPAQVELVVLRGGEGDDDVVPRGLKVAGPELPEAGEPAQGVILHHQAESRAHLRRLGQADLVMRRKNP